MSMSKRILEAMHRSVGRCQSNPAMIRRGCLPGQSTILIAVGLRKIVGLIIYCLHCDSHCHFFGGSAESALQTSEVQTSAMFAVQTLHCAEPHPRETSPFE